MALAAGVRIAAGTDAEVSYLSLGGETLARELALMVELGMAPAAAIDSATIDGRSCSGWSHEIGTLDVGRGADIILVAGDPLADLANLWRPQLVIRNGHVIHPASDGAALGVDWGVPVTGWIVDETSWLSAGASTGEHRFPPRNARRIGRPVRAAYWASGPTGRSSANIRLFYLTDEMAELARRSQATYREFTGVTGGDAGFRQTGIIYAPTPRSSIPGASRPSASLGKDLRSRCIPARNCSRSSLGSTCRTCTRLSSSLARVMRILWG